jgi:hypothetical protein
MRRITSSQEGSMIVVGFSSLEDFLVELKSEQGNIADKIVRWQSVRTPEQKEQVSFQVMVWATAIKRGGEIESLLELGVPTGRDRDKLENGSEEAAKLLAQLGEFCEANGLEIRPGKIEVY